MAECMEDHDALFEEAWNRIPCLYVGQCLDDYPSLLCEDQQTQDALDANEELTEQSSQTEDETSSSGKASREADNENRSQTARQGSSVQDTSSSPHGTGDRAFPDPRLDGSGGRVFCSGVQDLGEENEGFDVFEIKSESDDDSSDFEVNAEQRHLPDVTANMSKSPGQHQTTDGATTTTSAHLVLANKNPDSYVERCIPTEAREEMESTVGGHGGIGTIVRTPSHLNDDHGSIHFYRGLKNYQSRGKFTDVCIDDVRDMIERVVIGRRTYYRCKLCFTTIPKLHRTIEHAFGHARGKLFFCHQCGRKFRVKFSYDVHLEFHAQGQWREIPGPGSRLYTCQMCHKFFPTNALLSSHRITHKEEVPYRCGVCDKSFRTSKLRTRHENSHQSVKKKVECPVCGETIRSTTLTYHLKKHKYYKADIEAYACDKCPETFVSAAKLMSHLRARHPYRPFSATCETCGRSFCHPSILQQHQRACPARPTGRGRFPCKVCGKVFAKSMTLSRHKQIHSSTRPYKCRHCDMAFRQSDARHRHELLHFKDGEFRDVTRHSRKVSHGKDGRQFH
ncbi:uncharacterized protein [Diadema setosum]|uniref:uncharacterized protein n=1 Tax=Diadema setosum TaxID=31175 RepID=UPI003B3A8A31